MTHLDTTLSAITAIDSVLGMQRTLLLAAEKAADPVELAKVKGQIDASLDKRIELMKQRDELSPPVAVAPVAPAKKRVKKVVD
jgi:hypothetical protein